MRPKINFKPEAEDLVEALGLNHDEVLHLWVNAINDCKSGGECMALLWERAPTPQHALVAAFMVGVWFMHMEESKFKEEMDDEEGRDRGNP